MMSSEEETEFGLYADKLLKKAKRTRQRVDAGEPRNSYSSIPNFSSRPSFLGGNNNLYGAIFTQQQHFGLFGPGFGSAKMLNELLGRQKAESGAPQPDSGDEVVKFECNATRCGAGADGTSPPHSELAHHMLRDILQGRKHELLGIEHTTDNNNGIITNNNNNNNNNNETIKAQQQQREQQREQQQQQQRDQQQPQQQQQQQSPQQQQQQQRGERDVSLSDGEQAPTPQQQQQGRESSSSSVAQQRSVVVEPESAQDCDVLVGDGIGRQPAASELMDEALTGMDTDSLPSPKVEPASPAKPEDAKKARVENIVSGMRSSPAPPQVNGCKKRKLYQPQQHDSAADRYIDEEEDELEPIRQQKRIEKNALKSQLRTMQEQLAEMQQKYVQLCTRMEQESNCEEVEEITSDTEDTKRTPVSSPSTREPPVAPNSAPPVSLAQQVSKLKIGPPHMPPHFNGMMHDHHHHPHMSNAAAMYLGVSHKLFLEQEARMAKEAAVAAAVAESQHHHHQQQQQQHHQQQQQQQQQQHQQHHQHQQQQQQPPPPSAAVPKPDNIAERLNMIRNMTPTGSELEGLADALKSEITASLSNIIDSIVTRFVHQRRLKQSEASAAAEQLNKDLMMASQMLDRKSPRTKVADRSQQPGQQPNGPSSAAQMMNGSAGSYPQMMPSAMHMNSMQKPSDMHIRPPMFQPPKPPALGSVPLYGMNQHPFCAPERENPEQNEALSLVVTPKKKRHKVTDTRITPRTVSRILAQDGMGMSPATVEQNSCPSPRPYHQPPPMLPVSLPTSVAIPNPGLHESQVFSPYSPFFHGPSHGHHIPMQASSSPPGMNKMERESPPLPHPPTLLHPALLAAAQHGTSPDYGHIRAPSGTMNMDTGDRNSDCNSGDISYDGIQPTSSTLTPMHLRKAKLMFFWVRYPSSAVLKMYFPDIKFNKNNTAQLVKWFSNFREFYYIQMEKYARQAVSEGVKNADDLHVSADSEIYRVLNLHYNRNNHIEVWGPQVPPNFRFVVEQTLREFFKAIQGGKDAEQSWKKSIYKIISRLDDPVPEYFKSPNFLEQLE